MPPWPRLFVGFWLAGVLICLVRMVRETVGVERLRRRCQPLKDEGILAMAEGLRASLRLSQRVRILVSEEIGVPAVMGIFWPVILLPAAMLTGIPAEAWRAILAHELAHVRRWDYLANLGQMLIEALLFFNPFVWWISRHIRLEREACCDQLAAAECQSPAGYVHALLAVIERSRGQGVAAPAPMLAASGPERAGGRGDEVLDRARRLLVPGYLPALKLRWFSLVLVLVFFSGGFAGLWSGSKAIAQTIKTTEPSEKAAGSSGDKDRLVSTEPKLERVSDAVTVRDVAPVATAATAATADSSPALDTTPTTQHSALSGEGEAATPTVVVAGSVTGPDGQPVAGARVLIFDGGDHIIEVPTQSDGAFHASIPDPKSGQDPLGVHAVILAPGLAVGGGYLSREPTRFELVPASELQGLVADSDGKPVVDAEVQLVAVGSAPDDEMGAIWPIEGSFTSRSNADGQWTLRGIPADRSARLVLSDARFVRQQIRIRTGRPVPTLVAMPGASLRGRVVTKDGLAAPPVTVFAQYLKASGNFKTRSEADGSYVLSGLVPGACNVMVSDQPDNVVAAALEEVVIEESQIRDVPDLVLDSGGIIEGRILDADTGAPIAGAHVGNYGPHRPRSTGAITGAYSNVEGEFKLRSAPGMNYIYVQSAPSAYTLSKLNSSEISVEDGETNHVTFRIGKGHSLRGVVVSENGEPVAGGGFYLKQKSFERGVATVEEGRFSVQGLPAGEFKLLSGGDWDVIEPEAVRLPTAEEVRVIIRRLKMVSLEGRVMDEEGTPVAGATVSVALSIPGKTFGSDVKSSELAVTEKDGRFSVSGIRPDQDVESIEVRQPGFETVRGGEFKRTESGWSLSNFILKAVE